MRKVLYLDLYINGEWFDTLDMYDATEDYETALLQATEDFDWSNNQEWFDDTYGEDFTKTSQWELKINLIES